MDLKIKDVADLLNVSESTVRRWIADRKIPFYYLHQNQYRFSRQEIEDWVLQRKKPQGKECEADLESTQKQGLMQYALYRAIHNGGIHHKVPGANKEEVIQNASKIIAKTLQLDSDVLAELLIDREKLMPTALNNGIGIPHARDFLLEGNQDIMAVVYPEAPIEYGSLDNVPVSVLFFLFAADDKRHLHLLAKVAHLCGNPETLNKIKSQPQKKEFLDFIKNWESTINLNRTN